MDNGSSKSQQQLQPKRKRYAPARVAHINVRLSYAENLALERLAVKSGGSVSDALRAALAAEAARQGVDHE